MLIFWAPKSEFESLLYGPNSYRDTFSVYQLIFEGKISNRHISIIEAHSSRLYETSELGCYESLDIQKTLERSFAFRYAVTMDSKDKKLEQEEIQGDVAAPSITATELKSLRDTVLKFAANRERLPQPLFWSLFNARIADIKKNKERCRLLEEILNK